MGLGVSQCPLLIPRASLSPRTPREGTSFLKQWTAPTPRSQTLFPHFPEDHPPKPDTDPTPCLPPAPTFPQLLVLPLHPHPEPLSASDPPRPPAAPPALLSLHSQGMGALRRGQRGRPRYKAGETPRCSPTRDRVAGEEGGSFARETPSLLLPATSPRPRTRVAGATRLHGLCAAPTGRPDICNQHGGSGEGRAARPGGKLTLTLSLIKQNNRAAIWSRDVAAAGGAAMGALRGRPPRSPHRDGTGPGVPGPPGPCRLGTGNAVFSPFCTKNKHFRGGCHACPCPCVGRGSCGAQGGAGRASRGARGGGFR